MMQLTLIEGKPRVRRPLTAFRAAFLPMVMLVLAQWGCDKARVESAKTSEGPMEIWLSAVKAEDPNGILKGISRLSRETWDEEGLKEALVRRKQLIGREMEKYRIQAISEKGGESRIHVVWTRKGGGHGTRFRETFVLVKENEDWKVVLGPNWYRE